MYSARDLAMRVRDGLLLLEQQEQQQPSTLIDELEQEADASLRTIQNLIDAMARQRRLWLANGMQQAIADPNVDIGGTFSRARWAEIEEAFNAFETWMQTPLATSKTVPLVIVSRRGNPPDPVAVEPEPEPEEPAE
jgi:hypothetical protein